MPSVSSDSSLGYAAMLPAHWMPQSNPKIPSFGDFEVKNGIQAPHVAPSQKLEPFRRNSNTIRALQPCAIAKKTGGVAVYGYRHYTPKTGQFLGRDPIEEKGGYNLYGFVGNDGVGTIDFIGMAYETTPQNYWTKSKTGKYNLIDGPPVAMEAKVQFFSKTEFGSKLEFKGDYGGVHLSSIIGIDASYISSIKVNFIYSYKEWEWIIQEKEWETYTLHFSASNQSTSGESSCYSGDIELSSNCSSGSGGIGHGCCEFTIKCAKPSTIRNGRSYPLYEKDVDSTGDLIRVNDDKSRVIVATGVTEATQARLRQEKFGELIQINYGLR